MAAAAVGAARIRTRMIAAVALAKTRVPELPGPVSRHSSQGGDGLEEWIS